MTRPALIVHGGAGFIPDEEQPDYINGCKRAAEVAWKLLEGGASALHAVEVAVRILEDDPTFDSGYGSVLNREGVIEVDAIIMDGQKLDLGAVIAVKNIANPVTLARLVMTETPHKVLAGDGARAFAQSQGIPLVENEALISAKARARHEHSLATHSIEEQDRRGTCGAVALDRDGNIAAATSTGGVPFKMPGRVGDSPLVGSGAYADNETGGASATGDGEQIMRVCLAKTVTDAIGQGMTAQEAADYAIKRLVDRVQGKGGVIVVDHAGNIGFAHSDRNIAVAYAAPIDAEITEIRTAMHR